jgi:Spy/CpxP family protein refolding chaperone
MSVSRSTMTIAAATLALAIAGVTPAKSDDDDSRGGWFNGWGMGHMMGGGWAVAAGAAWVSAVKQCWIAWMAGLPS